MTPTNTHPNTCSDGSRRFADGPDERVRCGRRCGQKCGLGVRTLGRPRPHRHWGFAGSVSPTTRPPHRSEKGGVRVVGLTSSCEQVSVGAGPAKREIDGEIQGVEAVVKMRREELRELLLAASGRVADGMGRWGDGA
jgi:hypothetical protein